MIIKKIMEHGENRLQLARESYLDILCRCKIIARKKHEKRQFDEKYLGKYLFANEFHCSFDEFIVNVVSTLGCHPLGIPSMEYSYMCAELMQRKSARSGSMKHHVELKIFIR
jgi:hypothetical protein